MAISLLTWKSTTSRSTTFLFAFMALQVWYGRSLSGILPFIRSSIMKFHWLEFDSAEIDCYGPDRKWACSQIWQHKKRIQTWTSTKRLRKGFSLFAITWIAYAPPVCLMVSVLRLLVPNSISPVKTSHSRLSARSPLWPRRTSEPYTTHRAIGIVSNPI
jgi:hypothetical protein